MATDAPAKVPNSTEDIRLRNLRRNGRKKGATNLATRDIKAAARAWTLDDPEWVKSARERMKDGRAPHLETYLLQMGYGKPKDDAQPALPAATTVNILALLGSLPVEQLRALTAQLSDGDTDRG